MNENPLFQLNRPRSKQSGAAAVEFALVFPILFAVVYGAIVYSYVYMLQQSVNFAVQQGAQAAVAVAPQSDIVATKNRRLSDATTAAQTTLSWLPGNQFSRISVTSPADCGSGVGPNAGSSFVLQVNFDLGGAGGALFPTLGNLPFVGTIPPLPATLVACTVAFT